MSPTVYSLLGNDMNAISEFNVEGCREVVVFFISIHVLHLSMALHGGGEVLLKGPVVSEKRKK